jgi:threonine dehydrogenase-like Zn-dependent dehydrogenase
MTAKSVSHMQPGDRVVYWPGVLQGESYYGRALSTVWPKESNNFGTDVVRIEKAGGGTDYIATTHLQVVEPA